MQEKLIERAKRKNISMKAYRRKLNIPNNVRDEDIVLNTDTNSVTVTVTEDDYKQLQLNVVKPKESIWGKIRNLLR
jgi:hypothetical protein